MARGYYIVARKTLESEIWRKPPLYWKVWSYLLAKANWDDFGNLKRGQFFTTLDEIAEGNHWYIGYRKVVPKKSQIFDVLEWLRTFHEGSHESNGESNDESNDKQTMITTTKATRGILINIVKYGIYQDPKYYESNNESNNEDCTKPMTAEQRSEKQANTKKEEYKEDKEYKESLLMNNNTPEWFDTEVQKQDQADQEQKNIYECSLFDLFEREFARPLSQPECQRLGDWQERYDDKLIRYALRESLLYGKHSLDYIDRILLAWEKKAFTAEMYENGER